METSFFSLIFIGICCLALISQSKAECCREAEIVTYIGDQDCEAYEATSNHHIQLRLCTTTICADGWTRKGFYCGKGRCDFFGCDCDGGCLTGNWVESFKEHYKRLNVHVLSVRKHEQDFPIPNKSEA